MKSGGRLSACSTQTSSQKIRRSLRASRMRILRRFSPASGKSGLVAPLAESAGAAPRLSTSPDESSDSRRSSLGLADEGTDTIVCGALYRVRRSLQYRSFAFGAFGNHDQA